MQTLITNKHKLPPRILAIIFDYDEHESKGEFAKTAAFIDVANMLKDMPKERLVSMAETCQHKWNKQLIEASLEVYHGVL